MDRWDCVVVGGGSAGLSAALVLGRARCRTLLVDAGRQSNLAADGIGGLLGQDGRPPADFYAAGRRELAAYPSVEIRDGEVTGGRREDDGFALELGQEAVLSRTVLLATGMDYDYPSLPGADERWGRSVFHCPFCHGWEVRERPIGVLATDARAIHQISLLRAWSEDVTLYANGVELDAEDRDRLVAAGISIEDRRVARLGGEAPELSEVVLDDGSTVRCEGLLVAATLRQRSELAWQLGAKPAEPTAVVADGVAVDGVFRTDVPGLVAVGDTSVHMPSVAAAIASGSVAAAGLVGLLATS